MGSFADSRRRLLGVVFLIAAALMLLCGLTLLKDRMSPKVFVIYWMSCMVLTLATMIIALLDLRAVRQRSRNEQRLLAKTVLREFLEDSPDSEPK